MFVLPLGLGSKLRHFPVVTSGIVVVWALFLCLDFRGSSIDRGINSAVATSGVKKSARALFYEYCLERRGSRFDCRRLSVLVYTGYPSKLANLELPLGSPSNQADAHRAESKVAELKLAKRVRQALRECGNSKRCFAYKDIVWQFLENFRTSPRRFRTLGSYSSYVNDTITYRRALRQMCATEACLIRGRVTPSSLVLAQTRHGSLFHLAGNGFLLLMFGSYVEQRIKKWLYGLVLLLGGTIGLYAQASMLSAGDMITFGGSANVAAAMGLFFVFFFQSRLKLFVWLPVGPIKGRSFLAPVRYCLPLLFLLPDMTGQLQDNFATLGNTPIAHVAHLGGFAIGTLFGLVILLGEGYGHRRIYHRESTDEAQLYLEDDLFRMLRMARQILTWSPENTRVMQYAIRQACVVLKNSGTDLENLDGCTSAKFVKDFLPCYLAIELHRGNIETVLDLMDSAVFPELNYAIYLPRLGQRNTIRLADEAVTGGRYLIALRTYDYYLARFPLSRKCESITATARALLAAMPISASTVEEFREYCATHPNSPVVELIVAWLARNPSYKHVYDQGGSLEIDRKSDRSKPSQGVC